MGLDLGNYALSLTKPDADKHFIHDQGTSSATWNIQHNLNKHPAVEVVDTGGTVVIGQVTYVDKNNLTIVFSAPFGGKAYLN
tara:strand:+ start:417 stop:662 length:246 start_codon:yes stop_codon:yes gene_type:complete